MSSIAYRRPIVLKYPIALYHIKILSTQALTPPKYHMMTGQDGWFRSIPNWYHAPLLGKSQLSIPSHKVPQDRMDGLERSQQVPLSLGKSQLSIPSRRTMGQDGRFRNIPNRYHSHWVNPNCPSHPKVPQDRMDCLERSQQVPLSLDKSQLSIPSRRTMGPVHPIPLYPFCTSSISTSMNTVSVKKTSNIQAVEIQITLQDGHHLANYNENEIHENLQAFVSSDK